MLDDIAKKSLLLISIDKKENISSLFFTDQLDLCLGRKDKTKKLIDELQSIIDYIRFYDSLV